MKFGSQRGLLGAAFASSCQFQTQAGKFPASALSLDSQGSLSHLLLHLQTILQSLEDRVPVEKKTLIF